jgi:hypothetical protein
MRMCEQRRGDDGLRRLLLSEADAMSVVSTADMVPGRLLLQANALSVLSNGVVLRRLLPEAHASHMLSVAPDTEWLR